MIHMVDIHAHHRPHSRVGTDGPVGALDEPLLAELFPTG